MWSPLPPDAPHQCAVCARGGHEPGPFWVGPEVALGPDGSGGLLRGRLAVCRQCMFVVVNHPSSPFHGLLPLAAESAGTIRSLDEERRRLTGEVEALREQAAEVTVQAVAESAADAVIRELRASGALIAAQDAA